MDFDRGVCGFFHAAVFYRASARELEVSFANYYLWQMILSDVHLY